MKPKIDKPHIFISYAWGSPEHDGKVIQFAESLVKDGIQVELDKWSLKEGNDTYAFMEQMVNNPKITNVLLLLDKKYAEKANSREGGVGTETQIISPEIYEKVKQEKFIPIVFERDDDGGICKPAYLKGILHFDLSIDKYYSSEYQRLVKRLYGVDIFKKPELGNPPEWLTKNETFINPKVEFSKAFSASNVKERKHEIGNIFNLIKNDMFKTISEYNLNEQNYLDSYRSAQEFRNKITALISSFIWDESLPGEVAEFFENAKNGRLENEANNALKDTLLHESFIYAVGLFFKMKNYDSLAYILNKTYFDAIEFESAKPFILFYDYNQSLNNIVSHRDGKTYYSGTAHLWMETIDIELLSKNEFIAADNLLYNVAIFGKNYNNHWPWFPISYVYDERNQIIMEIGKKMVSREHLASISELFGFKDPHEFIESIKIKLEELKNSKDIRRYSGSWHDAPLITDFFKIEEAGSLN